jgi:hypothetical protein
MKRHLIGLLLGTEIDWPGAFEALVRRLSLDIVEGGERHTLDTERLAIEPFDLRAHPRAAIVIDRLAYWYQHPREWLKKAAMMDDVYLINNPFTFQSMEKHTAFCGMIRLGLRIPETWLLPPKIGPADDRFSIVAQRYQRLFQLDAIAERIGYPLYLKPFDGGAWVGVTRVDGPEALHRAYDASGNRMMHLQKAVTDYQIFCRALSVGPQTLVMRYYPERPMHDRYAIEHGFLTPELGREVETIGRLVNAFFRWEFNSCETLIKDGVVYPIDFANACPDVALASLHYYFPWAMKALVRWSAFCTVTGRRMAIDMDKRRYFAIGDRGDLDYTGKLREYEKLTTAYFDTARFEEFCARHLRHLDDVALDYFASREFDDLLVSVVRETFPPHEHDGFIGHYRGLFAHWVNSESQRLSPRGGAPAAEGVVEVPRPDATARRP